MIDGKDHESISLDWAELLSSELEARWGASAGADQQEIAGRVAALWQRGRAAWPAIRVEPGRFVAHLARHLDQDALGGALDELHAEDLYLALGCGDGDPAAIAEFTRLHAGDLGLAMARVRGSGSDAEDVQQRVYQRLFVGSAESAPKILDYSGQGRLQGWFRVVLVRALLDAARSKDPGEALGDEQFLGIASPERDPELQYLRQNYSHEFRLAFEGAARELDAEDRNALRAFYSQGLTIDQMAAMLGIHRATAARRVASARERLLAHTRRNLMLKLKLSRAELESVMRLIQSGLTVSVHRVFAQLPEPNSPS